MQRPVAQGHSQTQRPDERRPQRPGLRPAPLWPAVSCVRKQHSYPGNLQRSLLDQEVILKMVIESNLEIKYAKHRKTKSGR